MSPILIAPPAVEPLSLAEAKLYLKLDGDDEDELVARLIAAARLLVEAASGRQLIAQTWRLAFARWPEGALRLPLSPVTEVAALRLVGPDGVAVAAPEDAAALDAGFDPPEVAFVPEARALLRVGGHVELDVVAGYGADGSAVPASLRQAMLMLVARWFERRGDSVHGADASLPGEVMALVAPHRRARL